MFQLQVSVTCSWTNSQQMHLLDPILPSYFDLYAKNKFNFVYIWGNDICKGPGSCSVNLVFLQKYSRKFMIGKLGWIRYKNGISPQGILWEADVFRYVSRKHFQSAWLIRGWWACAETENVDAPCVTAAGALHRGTQPRSALAKMILCYLEKSWAWVTKGKAEKQLSLD